MRGSSVVHAVILCSLFLASRADAEGRCVLRLDDVAAPREWRAAVAAVAEGLGTGDAGDCAEIRVTPETRGAMVTFTTWDGRVAQRHIRHPNELGPLVDALTVTVPPEPVPAIGPPPMLAITESSPTATEPAEGPIPALQLEAPTNEDRPTVPAPGRTALVVFAGGGARMDGRSAVAPQGQLGLGVAIGKWELDLVGRIEAEHDMESTAHVHNEASSMGVGARVGRREKVGPLLLVTGVSVAAQYASVEAHLSRTERKEVDFLEPRAGAFIGVVGPRLGRFRLRGEVIGEVALSQRAGTTDLPATSGWGVGCMFGLETSFLP